MAIIVSGLNWYLTAPLKFTSSRLSIPSYFEIDGSSGSTSSIYTIEIVLGDTPNSSDPAFTIVGVKGRLPLTKDYTLGYLLTWDDAFGTNDTTVKAYARLNYGTLDSPLYTYSTVKTITREDAPSLINVNVVSSRVDGLYVEGLTTATVTALGSASWSGATISSITANIPAMNGKSAVTKNMSGTGTIADPYTCVFTANELPYGDVPITVTATNNRGETSTVVYNITVANHLAPTISADVFRCDSGGDVDLSGAYLSVTVYANSNPVELGLNNISMSGSFSQASLTSGQTYIIGGAIDPDTAYSLTFTAQDTASSSASLTVPVRAVKRIIDIKDGGTGIAFGKKAERDSAVDSEWPVYANGYFYACEKDTAPTSRGYAISFDEGQGSDGAAYMGRASYVKDGVTHYDPARWIFSLYSRDSVTHERLAYPERYRLPVVDNDLTAEVLYNILTTKDFLKVFTHTTGVSKTYNLANSTRGLLVITGQNAGVKGAYIFNTTSAGSVSYTAILAASSITLTTGTNSLTVANGSTTATAFACFLVFNGSVEA